MTASPTAKAVGVSPAAAVVDSFAFVETVATVSPTTLVVGAPLSLSAAARHVSASARHEDSDDDDADVREVLLLGGDRSAGSSTADEPGAVLLASSLALLRSSRSRRSRLKSAKSDAEDEEEEEAALLVLMVLLGDDHSTWRLLRAAPTTATPTSSPRTRESALRCCGDVGSSMFRISSSVKSAGAIVERREAHETPQRV